MNLFVPIVFTILISNQVGYVYTRSLYERAIRGKQMPILIDDVPEPCKYIIAEDFMKKKVISLASVEKVKNIVKALKSGHHAFPVLNKSGNAAGIIARNFLITILRKKAFYTVDLTQINLENQTKDRRGSSVQTTKSANLGLIPEISEEYTDDDGL